MQPSDTIWDERSSRERLTRILPGFRGYELLEHRRETDALFRSFGLHRLDQVRSHVEKARCQLKGRERAPYRGVAKRLARLCMDLATHAPRALLERESSFAALGDLYAQEEDVVRGVVALSVAVHERSTRLEDLARELERVERGLARRRELLAALVA